MTLVCTELTRKSECQPKKLQLKRRRRSAVSNWSKIAFEFFVQRLLNAVGILWLAKPLHGCLSGIRLSACCLTLCLVAWEHSICGFLFPFFLSSLLLNLSPRAAQASSTKLPRLRARGASFGELNHNLAECMNKIEFCPTDSKECAQHTCRKASRLA